MRENNRDHACVCLRSMTWTQTPRGVKFGVRCVCDEAEHLRCLDPGICFHMTTTRAAWARSAAAPATARRTRSCKRTACRTRRMDSRGPPGGCLHPISLPALGVHGLQAEVLRPDTHADPDPYLKPILALPRPVPNPRFDLNRPYPTLRCRWGLDKPWPNARCGNDEQEYAENAMWCQRVSAAVWSCAIVSVPPRDALMRS